MGDQGRRANFGLTIETWEKGRLQGGKGRAQGDGGKPRKHTVKQARNEASWGSTNRMVKIMGGEKRGRGQKTKKWRGETELKQRSCVFTQRLPSNSKLRKEKRGEGKDKRDPA